MSIDSGSDETRTLQGAQALLANGQLDAALDKLLPLARRGSGDHRVYKLLGVARAQMGDLPAALEAFREGVRLQPTDEGCWANLARVLVDLRRDEDAVQAFGRCLELAPGQVDIRYELAAVHARLGQPVPGRGLLEEVVREVPTHAAAWCLLGQLAQAEGNPDEALAHFDRCLALDPEGVIALHGKASIYRQRDQFQEAADLAHDAVRLAPAIPAFHRTLGDSYAALGELDHALDAYEQAIRLEPGRVSHHQRLNELLWVSGRDGFLDSYEEALKTYPRAHALRRQLVHTALQADRFEQAKMHADRLVHEEPENASNQQLLGGVLRKDRRFLAAIDAHQEAQRLNPTSAQIKQELATSLLANADPEPALQLLAELHAADPLHQGYLALQATGLRLQGSEAYHELYDYERLLLIDQIDVPDGFASLDAFNSELATYLETLHLAKEHPLDQSLVNGTQTIDDLFQDPHELIQALRHCLEASTRRLMAQLPREAGHPALSRLNLPAVCSGAWSVRLRSDGFHLNHYHDQGWFSGPYYVSLPDVMGQGTDQQGWLKLGEPGFPCVEALPADRLIQPEAGMLVRFPSYFWHGTVPFHSDSPRLVVSLDLSPGA